MSKFWGTASRPEDGYLGATEAGEGKAPCASTKSQSGECSVLELSWDIPLPNSNKTKMILGALIQFV